MSLPTYEETIEFTRKDRAARNYPAVTHSERCVQCGRPEAQHIDGGLCRAGGTDRFATMELPDGNTCADCYHCRRCVLIFGKLPEDRSCDFFPVTFYPVRPVRKPL